MALPRKLFYSTTLPDRDTDAGQTIGGGKSSKSHNPTLGTLPATTPSHPVSTPDTVSDTTFDTLDSIIDAPAAPLEPMDTAAPNRPVALLHATTAPTTSHQDTDSGQTLGCSHPSQSGRPTLAANAVPIPPHSTTPARIAEALRLHSLTPRTIVPSQQGVLYSWDRLQHDEATPCSGGVFRGYRGIDKCILEGIEPSSELMTHKLRISTQQPGPSTSCWKDQFILTLYRAMDKRGILKQHTVPSIHFSGDTAHIYCPTIEVLSLLSDLLTGPIQYPGFTMTLASAGLSFRPRIWRFDGLSGHPDAHVFQDHLDAYLAANKERIGRPKSIWAKFYRVTGYNLAKTFAGQLWVVTDADTIRQQEPPPAFHGTQPVQCSKATLH